MVIINQKYDWVYDIITINRMQSDRVLMIDYYQLIIKFVA